MLPRFYFESASSLLGDSYEDGDVELLAAAFAVSAGSAAAGTLVNIRMACMALISSLRICVTRRFCLSVERPRNLSDVTCTTYCAPQPPATPQEKESSDPRPPEGRARSLCRLFASLLFSSHLFSSLSVSQVESKQAVRCARAYQRCPPPQRGPSQAPCGASLQWLALRNSSRATCCPRCASPGATGKHNDGCYAGPPPPTGGGHSPDTARGRRHAERLPLFLHTHST